MSLWESPVRDVRASVTEERDMLIALLETLAAHEWLAASAAPGWTVKDLVLHLLYGDLSWLSRQRDQDASGVVDMSDRASFARRLAEKNQRWVDGASELSRGVVTELLTWSGEQVDRFHAAQDLRGEGWVSWASNGPVPYWFNVAQEFTERWIHQQQIREALGRVEEHEAYLPEVLRTLVWAFPHQYRVPAPRGTEVELSLGQAGVWTLTADGARRWSLSAGPAHASAASLTLSGKAAWRMLTAAHVGPESACASGPLELTAPLMQVRGIIV